MATRRIVQHGSSSLTITLPAKWVKKNHLHKGEEIKITEEGAYLLIGGRGKKDVVSKMVTIKDSKIPAVAIMHYIAALYRAGYDKVEFTYDTAEVYKAIERVTGSDLNGWDIIESKKNSCTVESISTTEQANFKNVLSKLLYNLLELSKESLSAIKDKNTKAIEMAQTKDNVINRNANFCERVLIKDGHEDPDKLPFLFYIIKELENIGDEYNDICNYYLKTKKINPKTIKLYEETNEIFAGFKRFYEKMVIDKAFSFEEASIFYGKVLETTDKAFSLLDANQEDDRILHHLLSVLRRVKSCLGCLFSIMIVEESK